MVGADQPGTATGDGGGGATPAGTVQVVEGKALGRLGADQLAARVAAAPASQNDFERF